MPEDKNEKLVDSSLCVPFIGGTEINPGRRLPQYDNGFVKAYSAHDERTQATPYIALLSDVQDFPRWNAINAYNSLTDSSLMHLHKSGICDWPDQTQKYVFLYRGNIGDRLVEEGGFNKTHWRHPDIIERFIQPMARILIEMRDKHFCHGAIRPSNIYHGSTNKDKPVILGDCLSAFPLSTQSPIYLTTEKSLASPFGRGDITFADDIYAFGVSLAMFLRKENPNEGLNHEDILRKKMDMGSYFALVGNERFQENFIEILRGLLHDDPNQRWTAEELSSWLDGTRMTPPPIVRRKKATRPLNFMGERYFVPDMLALDLHKSPENAFSLVGSGAFKRWLEKSVEDKDATERYMQAVENVENVGEISDHKDLLVTQLRIALCPELPLHYKGYTFAYSGLGGLLGQCLLREEDIKVFEEIINLNIPFHAMQALHLGQAEIIHHLKKFDECRACLKQSKPGFGTERCVYVLAGSIPCLSKRFKGFFITGFAAILKAFEMLCARGEGLSLVLDRHSIAFFSVLDRNSIEQCYYDLNSGTKDDKIAGNLRFFAIAQRKVNVKALPASAKEFLGALSGIYKKFHNRDTRKYIEDGVKKAAAQGDLVGISALLDNTDILARDENGFKRARKEYILLQNEYDDYERRLANKRTYGTINGRNAASFVSITFSMLIILIVILSYFSGHRMF